VRLAEQLRAIADRLDEADVLRRAVVDDLVELTADKIALLDDWDEPDSASVPMADGGAGSPGEAQHSPSASSPAAPITHPRSGRGEDPTATGRPTPATSLVPCPECGKLVDPRGLGTHRRHMHGHKAAPAKASVTCPQCGEVLAQRKNLSRHRRLHRAADPVAVPIAPIELVLRKGEEWFLCTRCSDRFRTAEALKGHMQKGHGPSPAAATRPFGEQPVLEHQVRVVGE
jgi:uncharacterized C2H2 Zn-finger protein